MLFLLCEMDDERYALDVMQIVEVLPLVQIQPAAHAPQHVVGLVNYRGAPVPVVDLAQLLCGRASSARLSSRVIILDCPNARGTGRLGLIAEHAVQTIRRDPADFVASGIGDGRAVCPAASGSGDRGVIQWLDPNALLTPSMRQALFAATGAA